MHCRKLIANLEAPCPARMTPEERSKSAVSSHSLNWRTPGEFSLKKAPRCPFCGHEETEVNELELIDDDANEHECESCERSYFITVYQPDPVYTTYTLKDSTDAE